MTFKVVILCGGSGTRLWPESRVNLPKQFIKLFGKKSLFDLTLERFLKIKSKVRPLIVCNKKHLFLVKSSLNFYKVSADIIIEPEGKNTTAAIYLAAKLSEKNDNLLIMPSDHLIFETNKFVNDINNINKICNFKNWVTLGIKPTHPSEAYGYINIDKSSKNVPQKVIRFIEKPSKAVALKLYNQKNYLWNSGIFLGNSQMIINSINSYANDISVACDNVLKYKLINDDNALEINFPKDKFSLIPSKSIDFSVMEFEKNIQMFPLTCDWSDVGSWHAVAEIEGYQNHSKNIIQIESKNNFIRNDNRIIATIGVNDLIIIDHDDTTLIMNKIHTEKVKQVVDELNQRGLIQSKEHTFEYRPWGKFEVLLDNEVCKVKKITVSSGKRLSLQYHNHRTEHWFIIKGQATVYLDGDIFELTEGMSIDIPKKSQHYIHNKTDESLDIIETQLGNYFGEDDIIRLDDPYGR